MKKDFYKFLVAIGFFIFTVGLLIDSLILETPSLEILSAYSLATMFGFAFVFSSNATLNRFGYGLCAFAGVYGLTAVMFIPSDAIVANIGAIIMFVGIAIRVVVSIPEFFGYCKNAGSAPISQAEVYERLIDYSKMLADNVIDEREYEGLKAKLFGARPAKNSKDNFEELAKWKELAEQKLISEEEYNALKAKLLQLK